MRGRAGCALLALATALAASPPPARAFDRVLAAHSSDEHLLDGVKAPLDAEVRVFGPWQVQVPGSGEPVATFDWEPGVPVPWSLDWDGSVAHFHFGDAIAYDIELPKKVDFDSILFHAQAEGSGYAMRAQKLVLNVSGVGIGGPLPDVALADGTHPSDILLLRGVELVRGFELHGEMIVQLGTSPPPSHPDLRMEILVASLDDKCAHDDRDCDGVLDAQDNCPRIANADQADGDLDGVGD